MKLSIDRRESAPVYRQIVRQIRDLILANQLPAGFRLPPERRLAETLSVTRTTVNNAYEELKAQGLVEARVGRGTIVCPPRHPLPETDVTREIVWSHYFRGESLRPPDPLVRDLLDLAIRPGVISFSIGLPSPDYLPLAAFRETINAVIEEAGAQMLLQSPTEGHLPLRETLSQWLRIRGIHCPVDELIILSGSQQGVNLAARVFLNPGDTIIVEAPTYFGGIEAFRRAGVRFIAIPIDDDGMQVQTLAAVLRHHRPKLIYTLPTFQNPSGTVMSLERRQQLLHLAASYAIPILEDDTYSELRYDGSAVPSLKTLDTSGLVISVGTFSKILFPGLRLGWLAAPRDVARQFVLAKQTEDLHSGTVGQWVMDRMIRGGVLDAHIAQMRIVYKHHRNTMAQALRRHTVDGMRWNIPEGGFYFWCEVPPSVDRARFSAMAAEQKVSFLPGYACFTDEAPAAFVRLNFSYASPDDIEEGIRRFTVAIRESITPDEQMWKRRRSTSRPIV